MAIAAARRFRIGASTDYLSLAKPRVVLLHLVTASAAMFLAAEGMPPSSTLLLTLLGGGMAAAGSNALNCFFDKDLDGRMPRTRRRPLPAGRLAPLHSLLFGLAMALGGLGVLRLAVSELAALLALGALACYVAAYTLWLKRRNYLGTVIGSLAGAIPPLVGWVAVAGRLELAAFLIAAIIYLWTPPHFWALALWKRRDYEAAGLGVMPPGNIVRWVAGYAFPMVGLTLALVVLDSLGTTYTIAASLLGMIFLKKVLEVDRGHAAARSLYLYSIVYILLLFTAMIVDRLFVIWSA